MLLKQVCLIGKIKQPLIKRFLISHKEKKIKIIIFRLLKKKLNLFLLKIIIVNGSNSIKSDVVLI